jgi:hypothetical protein
MFGESCRGSSQKVATLDNTFNPSITIQVMIVAWSQVSQPAVDWPCPQSDFILTVAIGNYLMPRPKDVDDLGNAARDDKSVH